MSIHLPCETFLISETCCIYPVKLSPKNYVIANCLTGLTSHQRNLGFVFFLRNIKSYGW